MSIAIETRSCRQVRDFEHDTTLLEGTEWLFVVKSQDQLERRRRLLATRKSGKFGRTQERPTATGLLVRASLCDGEVRVRWQKEFPEPRHIIALADGTFLLTDVNSVKRVDGDGSILHHYSNASFAFLHTLCCDESEQRLLVTSSGYDAIIELDLATGDETFRWVAWDHGFNPDDDGNWLTLDRAKYEEYCAMGKKAVFVDVTDYGEQGITTAMRSAHPNVAVYDPYSEEKSCIVSIGHEGQLYRVNMLTHETTLVCEELNQMPHGLRSRNGGWYMTNTTRGELVFFDQWFASTDCVSVRNMGGKVAGTEDIEWVQQFVPAGAQKFLALDSNRALIGIDLATNRHNLFTPNANWCVQDALRLF